MGVVANIYNSVLSAPLQVFEIFKDHFGEEFVDLQGFPTLSEVEVAIPDSRATLRNVTQFINRTNSGFILVHFPSVRITNENDRHTDITHLYAKVPLMIDGRMEVRFSLNRAEYTTIHLRNNYMHSHISRIPFSDFTRFQEPCTGSGPINNTMSSLMAQFNPDIWRLFCVELDRYVRVESLAGGPYHRLEGLTADGGSSYNRIDANIPMCLKLQPEFIGAVRRGGTPLISPTLLASFIAYLINKKVLRFAWGSDGYKLAMSNTNAILVISNCFIEWYNTLVASSVVVPSLDVLKAQNTVRICKMVDGVLQAPYGSAAVTNPQQYEGQLVCTFKGQPVRIHIINEGTQEDENTYTILNVPLIGYILTKILNVVNFRYGRNVNSESERVEGSSSEGSSNPVEERVFYL